MIALVYMNHGRWVVDCPREGCDWAYQAMTEDGKPRYQASCEGGPDMFGRGWVRGCGVRVDVTWPPLDAALEIERVLYARARPVNRNWRHPETVDGLSRENEELLVGWNLERLAEAGIGVI